MITVKTFEDQIDILQKRGGALVFAPADSAIWVPDHRQQTMQAVITDHFVGAVCDLVSVTYLNRKNELVETTLAEYL